MTIPEGWTDDMSVNITTGKSEKELALSLMASLEIRESYEAMIQICIVNFGLSSDDAELALDRVQGGIVRAITCNRANKPDKEKDPLAWYSFNEVWETLPKKNWWSNKKDNKGKWVDWYNNLNCEQ